MTSFRISRSADLDLTRIVMGIADESGIDRAERVQREVLRATEQLGEYPRIGHPRVDLTARPVLVWSVFSFLIVYRPDAKPVEIARILHGARDPLDLRGEVGERPMKPYCVPSHTEDDVALDSPAGKWPTAGEVSTLAACEFQAPVDGTRRSHSKLRHGDAAWREDARRKIDDAYEASLRGESLPGEELIDWLRMRRESKRNSGL